jgi:ribosome maturation factor RimP
MIQEEVKRLLKEALEENESLFLIDLSFLAGSKIVIELDGDTGINLKECMRISRYIEYNLDREEEDFSLEVASVDISKPLKVSRQYQKNIGRILSIKTTEGDYLEGTVVRADLNEVSLEWKAREPKPIGKGKVTVHKKAVIDYNSIKEAKVKIIFN